MPYASQADLETRFTAEHVHQLADRDGEPDAGVIDAALADASAEIDDYLRGRYPVPLAMIPASINRIACDIARYRLAPADDQVTDEIRNRYKDGLRYLERVASGDIDLDLAVPAQAAGRVVASAKPRIFTDETMRGFK